MSTSNEKTTKRGRKSNYVLKEEKKKHENKTATSIVTLTDPLILHLNIKKEDLELIEKQNEKTDFSQKNQNRHYENIFYNYNPIINDPNPYDNHDNFSSVPQQIVNSRNKTKESKILSENNKDDNIQSNKKQSELKTITEMFQIPNDEVKNNNIKQNNDEKIKEQVTYVLKDLMINDEWCKQTNYWCYWDCHHFENTPFGIPIKHRNNKFQVIGCFCSLECAVAYNFNSNENLSDVWERYNLISMLSRKINYKNIVNAAISRKCLKVFGGNLTIEEFREKNSNNAIINVLNYPMVSLVEQVEEINDFFCKQQQDFIPLDKTRIEKIEEANKDKLLTHVKSSLEKSMNLKME